MVCGGPGASSAPFQHLGGGWAPTYCSSMKLAFAATDPRTIGVEWELALVDATTLELTPAAGRALDAVDDPKGGPIRREYLTSMVELVSGVHTEVGAAMADLAGSLATLRDLLGDEAVPVGIGAHPFSLAADQTHFDVDRYHVVAQRNGWWGRQMITQGTHVHVGVDHEAKVLPITTGLATLCPFFIALAGSSPYWQGEDTLFASNRTMLFQQLQTNGLPVPMETWEEFSAYAADLEEVGMIHAMGEIRWDVRPSTFGTVENRLTDSVPTFAELGAITAFTQAGAAYLANELDEGRPLLKLAPWFLSENKWRAARYGMDAEVITTDPRARVQTLRDRLAVWLERLTPFARKLGCEDELAACWTLAERGPSYARQRAAFEASGDLRDVVRLGIAETGAAAPLGF